MVAPATPSISFPIKDAAGAAVQGRTLPLDANGALAVAPTKADGTPINPATAEGLASILAKLLAAPATEAKQDALLAETARVGTRAYGVGTKLAVTGASAVSGGIAATEVMLHATARCFVKTGAAPTAVDTGDSIPLEAGEKFTMRITSGHKIAAVRSATDADGALFITPVA